MKRSILGIAISVALANVLWGDPSGAPAPNTIAFYAYDWDKQGHIVDRSGVTCAILRSDGLDEIGRTAPNGQITVSHERLFRPGNIAVMFCADSLESQCTSIRLNTNHLRGFEEYNVRVPISEVIDRQRVIVPAKKPRG